MRGSFEKRILQIVITKFTIFILFVKPRRCHTGLDRAELV